jgi:hypothetical protein
MNNQAQEALKMAIEALEEIHVGNMTPMAEINWNKALQACKEALEQPAQEPVAWIKALEIAYIQSYKEDERVTSRGWRTNLGLKPEPDDVALYTHPAPSWQGLSDDEIQEELKKMWDKGIIPSYSIVAFARAIETKLKEKNYE